MNRDDKLYNLTEFTCYIENKFGEVLKLTMKEKEYKGLVYLCQGFDILTGAKCIDAKKYPISNKKWFDFIKELYEVRLASWVEHYEKEDEDGNNCLWKITIKLQNGETFVRSGKGKYHPLWEGFITAIENLIEDSIDIEIGNI